MAQNTPFDLSKSMWGDMVSQCGGDADKARAMFAGFAQEEDRSEKERKMRNLKLNFPTLSDELIEAKLIEHNWDQEATIIPLWQALDAQKDAERRKQQEVEAEAREAQRVQQRKAANVQAHSFLQNLFAQVPGDKIQAMLDENEGDVDATTEQLLKLSREEEKERDAEVKRVQQEQELLRKQMELERLFKFDTLKKTFGEFVREEEIAEALKTHDWNMKDVTRSLLDLTEGRKIEQLQRLYPSVSLEQIQKTLQATNWNMNQAVPQLRDVQVLRRSEGAVSSSLGASKGKEKEDAVVVVNVEPEQQQPQQPATTVVVVTHKAKEEVPEKEEEEKPTATKSPLVSRKEDTEAFMMRSAIIEKELTDLIEAQKIEAEEEAKEQTPEALFKKMLSDKLRFGPEAVPGLPGMVPLTPKLIDQLNARKPFESQLMEKPVPSQAPKELPDEKGEPEGVLVAGNETSKVTLKASAPRVDVSQKITVEWESQNDTTTSDWIGLYRADASNSQYTTWNWIGKALKTGSLTFTATEFGQFNFRYFSKNRSNMLATSEVFTVGPSYTLSASQVAGEAKKIAVKFVQESGLVYSSAWIGMYQKSQQDNKQYITYEWASSAVDNTIAFDVPKTGHYEFRLFPLKNYIDVARTSLDLQGRDALVMKLEGGQLKIACDIRTVDPAMESAWIGVYLAGENDHRQYKKYKYVSSSAGEVTFIAPLAGGNYEARLFANKSLDAPVVVSNVVSVPPFASQA